MNLKKFLKKLAQVADFQQVPTEPVVEQPTPQPLPTEQVEQGVAQTGPLAPMPESPSIIHTDIAEWHPNRGRNKGQTYYYLQMTNVPEGEIGKFLTSLGYKFNPKFGSWSKQAKTDNALSFSSEFDTIEQKYQVTIGREAIGKMQEIFGFTGETTTDLGSTEVTDDIKKIKFVEEGQQQEIAEELLKNKLEEMAENLTSDETKAFMEQYLSVAKATQGKVHPYSFLNTMLIAWQNFDTDENGDAVRRSGFIAPASLWEKEFGRKVKEGSEGMEIFVPKGGKKEMKGAGMASLLKVLGQYNAMNQGNVDLTSDENIRKFFGYLKSLVAKKQLYQSNYAYLSNLINKNKEQFKTVKDVQDYLGGKLTKKETDTYYTNTTFMIKPVIFDIDQTEVIPGQESKDPKPKMDAVRAMWLGMQNEPDKLIDTLCDALSDSAKNGILMPGKKINVDYKSTGQAGGYSSGGNIVIDDTSAGERRFRSLVHEAAHELLHWGADRSQHSKADKEIDADATAYIVMNHYGVGTGAESLNYISMITKDKSVIMQRLKPILNASNAIIAAIEKQKGMEYDQSKNRQACKNWYKKLVKAHYSEPEQKGEGRGGSGTGQFGERRLGDWSEEHREEIAKMKDIIKRQDWVGLERYKQELMDYYVAPHNKKIVDGILSASMAGQRF